MASLVARLWHGDVPLGEAVWFYAVGYGLLINIITSMLFLIAVANEANLAMVLAIHVLPLPYNALMVVAVWRSAGRYPGPPARARAARLGTLALMLALSLT